MRCSQRPRELVVAGRCRAPLTWLRLAAVLCAACAGPAAPTDYPIVVRVESDPGVPLAKAEVARAGQVLGASDAAGLVPLALSGSPGETVPLEVSCPAGYRAPADALQVVLRPLSDPTRRPEYRASCRPELRSLVISVRAQNAANVPLKYLGKELARTDAQGAAHALLRLPPGESVSLVLDTSGPEHQQLRPQNPELKLTVPERDDVVVFDQPFSVEKPKQKPAPRHRGPTPIRI